jgi:hypothetical protein
MHVRFWCLGQKWPGGVQCRKGAWGVAEVLLVISDREGQRLVPSPRERQGMELQHGVAAHGVRSDICLPCTYDPMCCCCWHTAEFDGPCVGKRRWVLSTHRRSASF